MNLQVVSITLTVILNLIQNPFDEVKQNKSIVKSVKQGIKRFRVKHGMTHFFVILTTLTVPMNLIQGLFDVIKQNKAVAKFAKHLIKRL
jgi:hypothetical protein